MKKILFFLFTGILIHFSATAQFNTALSGHKKTQYGVRGGIDFTSYPSINSGIKPGFMLGILTDRFFNPLIGLRNEINYARKGFDFNNPSQSAVLNFNTLLTLNFGNSVQLLGGPQITYSAENMLNNAQGILDTDARSQTVNRLGVGTCVGATFGLSNLLSIGARYNLGFYKGKPSNMSSSSIGYKAVTRETLEIGLEYKIPY